VSRLGSGRCWRPSLKTFYGVGNYREVILLCLVPADQHLLAWNEFQKTMFSLGDAGKVAKQSSATPSISMDPRFF
jgi:hypothetical protein